MANIILDEKRTVGIGEVCAINLKYIHAAVLTLEDSDLNDDIINFYSNSRNSVSSDDEITFIKYLGNGFFIDLVSDQLLLTEVFNADDFGTAELQAMNEASQNEIEKMKEFWHSIQNPKNKTEFCDSFSIFIQNPLLIDIEKTPFMSINSEVTKKFASQSLEQVKSKMMSSKSMAQQALKQQYAKFEGQITKYLNTVEKVSTPKTM